jgi:hypothetical protein
VDSQKPYGDKTLTDQSTKRISFDEVMSYRNTPLSLFMLDAFSRSGAGTWITFNSSKAVSRFIYSGYQSEQNAGFAQQKRNTFSVDMVGTLSIGAPADLLFERSSYQDD